MNTPVINHAKAKTFRQLHNNSGSFLIPNPWDIGSARILEGLGYQALATTSAGFAWSQGVNDGNVTLEETLAHCRILCANTEVPISADLGFGFGASPADVQQCVQAAIETGLAGCSIEDASVADGKLFNFEQSVERISAASEVCRTLNPDFVLTARCEGFAYGQNDYEDTLKRLTAYAAAGADVLYAPGMSNIEQIEALNKSVDKPMNVLTGFTGMTATFDELAGLGIKRVSVGLQLARIAYGATVRAAQELQNAGCIEIADSGTRSSEIGRLMT